MYYRPPKSSCAEFELEKIEISQHSTADIISLPCASILLFLNGTGTTKTIENNTNQEFHSGEVYFLGAGERLAIENQQVDNLVVFRAHINLD